MSKTIRRVPVHRNLAWDAEYLGKCSIHQKSQKAKRKGSKQDLQRKLSDGYY